MTYSVLYRSYFRNTDVHRELSNPVLGKKMLISQKKKWKRKVTPKTNPAQQLVGCRKGSLK